MGACVHARLLQLCPTLWDHMDCRPPGSSFHGILQARQLLAALLKIIIIIIIIVKEKEELMKS